MQVSNSDIFMPARYSHTRIDTFRERLEIWKDPPSRQNSESQASTSEDVSKTEDKVSLTFLGQLWGGQSAESRVNTGSLPEKCQKGSATEYPFIS